MNNTELSNLRQWLNRPEMKRFKLKSLFNNHLTLVQDLNGVKFELAFSHSNDDEYNCLICIAILFWSIEFGWNSRKNKKCSARVCKTPSAENCNGCIYNQN